MSSLAIVRLLLRGILSLLAFVCVAPSQNYRGAFDLTNYFATPQCLVTNGAGAARPKVWNSANEPSGCAQVGGTNLAFPNGATVNPRGILVFPPTPVASYTRVEFSLLDLHGAFPSYPANSGFALSASLGIASGSLPTDGVDVAIFLRANASGGCESNNYFLDRRTITSQGDPRAKHILIPLPPKMLQRANVSLCIDVAPRSSNGNDRLYIQDPTIVAIASSIDLVGSFPQAQVRQFGGGSLPSTYAQLSQNWLAGGAGIVPASLLTSCSTGHRLPEGNNAPSNTIVIHPPSPSASFASVSYDTSALGAPLAPGFEWFFTGTFGLDQNVSPGDGVYVEIVADGLDFNGLHSGAVVHPALQGTFETVSGQRQVVLAVPLSIWASMPGFEISITIKPRSSNTGDVVLVEAPRLVALPMGYGLDNIEFFTFYHYYHSGAYPTGPGAYAPTLPQYNDIEASQSVGLVQPRAGGDISRVQECALLGKKAIVYAEREFFGDPFTGWQLRPDWLANWTSWKNNFILPNRNTIEYLYFEELYQFRNNNLSMNADLAMIVAQIKLDIPDIKIVVAEADNALAASNIDIPAAVDYLGSEGIYPLALPANLDSMESVLISRSKPSHKLLLVPPCIDAPGGPTSDPSKAAAIDDFLRLARTNHRFAGIIAWAWWHYPNPAAGASFLYYTPNQPPYVYPSAYRARWLNWGRSIKENHAGFNLGGSCPNAAVLKVYNTAPFGPGVWCVAGLRGAPPSSLGVLAVAGTPSTLPYACGGWVLDMPFVTSAFVTDAAGRYFFGFNGVSGSLDLYWQAAYFNGSSLDVSNIVQMFVP